MTSSRLRRGRLAGSRRHFLCSTLLIPLAAACGVRHDELNPAARVRIQAAVPKPDAKQIVFIDPGHGGIDWGAKARTPGGVWIGEKTFTLDLGLRTAAFLRSAGFQVILSRSSEPAADRWGVNDPPRDLNGDGDIDDIDDVQARINLANEATADVLLSIHLNALALPNGEADPKLGGVTTLYDPDRPFSAANKRLADLVQKQMLDIMGGLLGHAPRDWGAADDTTLLTPFTTSHTTYHHDVEIGPTEPHWVEASRMPGVISEPLFLTNPEEQAVVLREDARQSMAAGYARAIEAFLLGERPSEGPTGG